MRRIPKAGFMRTNEATLWDILSGRDMENVSTVPPGAASPQHAVVEKCHACSLQSYQESFGEMQEIAIPLINLNAFFHKPVPLIDER